MNFKSSLGRMFWKEYRAQRSVWLALLFGTVLLQSIVFPLEVYVGAIPAAYPFAVALAMSVCFAATAGAIAFAGEREEETDRWLSQLPIPASWLVGTKLTFAVLATALFTVATLLAAGMVVLFAGLPTGQIVGDRPEVLPRAMIGVFIWGLFFSLLTRSVLKALGLTAVAEIITTGIAGLIFDDFEPRIYFGILGCVLVADVWLARRWAFGMPVFSTGHISRAGWNRGTTIGRSGWLSHAVSAESPSVRTAGALLWREARAARPFLLAWFVLGVFCVDLQIRFLEPEIPTHLQFLLATPLVCGMMICVGDQRRGTFRFLTERGVNPAAVWLQKQVVWLSVMVGIVSLFVGWDFLTPDRFAVDQGVRTSELVDVFANAPAQQATIRFKGPVSHVRTWSWVWSLCLALFAVGQLASFWIRRTVLVGSAAFIMGLFTIYWHIIAAAGDLPLIWTTWPVSVLFLVATFTTCGVWMRENRGVRVGLVRVGWLLAIPLLLVIATARFRATQVPLVEASFDRQTWISQPYNQKLSALSPPLFNDLRQLTRPPANGSGQAPGHLGAQYAQVTSSVHELSRGLQESTSVSQERLAPDLLTGHQSEYLSIGTVMSYSAKRRVQDGELDTAWEDLLAALQVSEFLSTQVTCWSDWQECLLARESLFAAIQEWAQHPDQTADRIQRSIADLQRLSVAEWSTGPMLQNRYVLYRQLFELRGPLWEQVEREGTIWFDGLPVTSLIRSMPWTGERERLLRLMTMLTARSLQRPHPDFNAMVPAARIQFDHGPSDTEISRWVATTSYRVGDFADDLHTDSHGYSDIDRSWLETLARERGTLLILALNSYRREHGEFPERLEELVGEVLDELPRDPYSGADFQYASNGFESPVVPVFNYTIAAGQPLLWSVGLERATLAYHAEPFASPVGDVPADRYMASPLMRLPESPNFNADPVFPDRVRFVILGADPEWTRRVVNLYE